jgi:hypothetical protein
LGIFQNGPDNDDQLNFVLCLCVCFVFCVFLCKKMSMPSFKMSRSDYYDLLFFFNWKWEMPTYFDLICFWLFGSKMITWRLQDYGNFGKVQSKDCSPITNCFWMNLMMRSVFACCLLNLFLWPLKFGQISYGFGRASEFRAGPIRYCITIIIAMFLFFF